jgi:hypothetical protein
MNDTATAEAAVKSLEEKLEQANREGDLETLRAITTDDFRFTFGTGDSLDREGWIARLPARRLSPEAKSQDAKTEERARENKRGTVMLLTGLRAGESNDYVIEVHGDAAIANRRYSILDPDGSERCLRYVRVYRANGGAWQLVSHRYIHSVD